MAKQNFLSGGYYGKLGVTVGQRWKNIRTIRSYVIPANPRTKKQQANRGVFGGAVQMSQLANQMNYNATCFEHSDFSRWNYRMKTARALQDAGLLDLALIPLYPISFTPPFMITSFVGTDIVRNVSITFAVEGQFPQSDRVLSVMFHIFDSLGQDLGYRLYMGRYEIANPGFITVDIDNTDEITEDCKVILVSRDDVDSFTDMVASPMIDVEMQTMDIRAFVTEVLSVQKALTGITIVFNEPYKLPQSTTFTGSVHAVSAGQFVDVSGDGLTLNNSGGYFSVTIPCSYTDAQEILAFPEGSYISIDEIAALGATFQYTNEDVTENFTDTDLTRVISPNFTYNASEAANNRIFFTLAVGESESVSGGGCVCSGRFDDKSFISTSLFLSSYGARVAQLSPSGFAGGAPMRAGDYIRVPAFSVSINGVTYSLQAQTDVNVINNISVSRYLATLGTEGYFVEKDSDGTLYNFRIGFSDVVYDTADIMTPPATNDACIYFGASGSQQLSDVMEITADTPEDSYFELYFGVDNEPVSQPSWLTGASGNNWNVNYKNISYEIPIADIPGRVSEWEEV